MNNKIFLSVLFIVFVSINSLSSQDTTKVESSSDIKNKIEKIIEDEYIRIPKKDFDSILENRISNLVNSKLNTLIGISIGLITLLSLFSVFQLYKSRESNEKLIKAEVNIAAKESISDIQKYFKENIESKLSDIEKHIEKNIELLKKEHESSLAVIHEQIEKSKHEVLRAEEYMTNLEIENLTNLIIKQKTYKYPEDLERTQNLLMDTASAENKFQIPTLINLLSYIYYDKKMYNEVNELITKYEKDYSLKSETYINGALTAIFDYHQFNSINQRNRCIEYLDKSLELTQGYGEALGLKLEIFMMDFLRAENDTQKEESKSNASKLISGILNSESKAPSIETLSRLSRDAKISSYKKYISALFEELPNEMEALLKVANDAANIFKITPFDINDFMAQK